MRPLGSYLSTTFENKVGSTPDSNLSGNGYISARERGSQMTRKTNKIIISSVERCGHLNRICLACAYQWGWDYDLHFRLTGGGRRFEAELIQHGLDPEAIATGRGKRPEGGPAADAPVEVESDSGNTCATTHRDRYPGLPPVEAQTAVSGDPSGPRDPSNEVPPFQIVDEEVVSNPAYWNANES